MQRLGLLVAPLLLLGAAPPPPSAPTGWGCTAQTLASGDRCVFEGTESAGAADPHSSAKSMADLASTVCALHLDPADKTAAADAIEAHCRAAIATTAQETCASHTALLDDQGRFVPSAKSCYRALTEVRQQAEWQASTVAPCCACLAEQHCVAAAGKCAESAVTSSHVEASNAKCALASCENACVGLLPDQASAESSPVKTRVSHR